MLPRRFLADDKIKPGLKDAALGVIDSALLRIKKPEQRADRQ